jgi:hypothetical protein
MSEQRLRAAFEDGVAGVGVAPDALPAIQAKVRRRVRQRQRLAVALAGVAAIAVGGTAVLLVTRPAPVPPPGIEPSTVDTSPSPQPSPTSTATAVPSTATVPVYFSGPGDRLFREYLKVTILYGGNGDAQALDRSLRGDADDPDYGTGWPAGARVQATSLGPDGVGTIDLTGIPTSTGPDPLAVQQLVYTYTAVWAEQGTQVSGVRISIDGVPLSGDQPFTRASSVDTLAPVWLISPQQGASVSRTFDVHLAGSVFEAAARLRVRDAGGNVVRDDQVMLSIGAPSRGEAHVSLTLPPGTYTLEAYYVSQADGSERGLDDHTITVS